MPDTDPAAIDHRAPRPRPKRFAVITGATHTARQAGRWWTGDDLSDAYLHAAWLNSEFEPWSERHQDVIRTATETVKSLESAYHEHRTDDLYGKALDARQILAQCKSDTFRPLPITDDDFDAIHKRIVRRRRVRVVVLAGSVIAFAYWRSITGELMLAAGGFFAVFAWAQGRWPTVLDPAPPELETGIDRALLAADPDPATLEIAPQQHVVSQEPTEPTRADLLQLLADVCGVREGAPLAELAAEAARRGWLFEKSDLRKRIEEQGAVYKAHRVEGKPVKGFPRENFPPDTPGAVPPQPETTAIAPGATVVYERGRGSNHHPAIPPPPQPDDPL